MGGWGWMESRWKVRKCPLEEIIYIWTDDRHILCVKKWRYAQSTCKLFFFSFLQYFYKCSALLQGFFLPILQCCLVFCCKNKNSLRYDELLFQLRIEKCEQWNYYVMILTIHIFTQIHVCCCTYLSPIIYIQFFCVHVIGWRGCVYTEQDFRHLPLAVWNAQRRIPANVWTTSPPFCQVTGKNTR